MTALSHTQTRVLARTHAELNGKDEAATLRGTFNNTLCLKVHSLRLTFIRNPFSF